MNVLKILDKLRSAGFTVSFDNRDILLDTPTGQAVLDKELKKAVQVNKQEILFHLRNREYTRLTAEAAKLGAYLDDTTVPFSEREARLCEYEALVNRISELQPYIDYYRRSGTEQWFRSGWILIRSEILGELIVVVHNASVQAPVGAQNYPRYEFKEVQALDGLDEEQIRQAHVARKIFDGQVMNPADNPTVGGGKILKNRRSP